MDVRCARCNTEYEFDDALVSERGTTVKCTNCGHQFKVYPGGGTGGGPERWIVRKASGRELVYTSLKELQRAISQRQVGPSDMLSRGGGQPTRRLEDIAELEPFFQSQAGTPQPAQRTLLGLSPRARSAPHEDTVPDEPPTLTDTMMSAPDGPPTHRVEHSAEPAPYDREPEPKTVPRNPSPPAGRVAALDATQPAHAPASGAGLQDSERTAHEVRIREVSPAPNLTPTPSDVSEGYRAYEERHTDPRFVSHIPTRPSPVRWVFGIALLLGLGIAAATVGRKYLERLVDKPAVETSEPPADDERVTKLLEEARERFFEGDLEEAKERLDKASVLAEKNPKIYAALARLEAARADVHWLAARLDETDAEKTARDRKRLDARLKKVKDAVEEAKATDPKNADVIRANIDYLRLAGKTDEARALVSSVSASASDPETAYVLAALDLSEDDPVWPSIIERLRAASSAEGDLGRARAALVYALARSGSFGQAAEELSRLDSRDEPHPLHERLAQFVQRLEASAADAGTMPEETAESDDDEATEEASPSDDSTAAGGEPGPGDFRTLLTDASRAKSSGDMTRARALYSKALEQSPGNVEAMAGLADVARAQGDTAIASRYYDQVLDRNPTYLPALMAKGDMKWAAGDRAGAVSMYRRVVQQSGPGSAYSARASRRIEEYEGGGGSTPPTTEAPAPAPEPTPAPAPQPEDQPHIDTSDLPGFE